MIGEIYVNMIEQDRPLYGSSSFMLKRWQKFSIYSKSGSYNRSDNLTSNQYQSCSIYLYDYVVVSKNFYSKIVYTASIVDNTASINSDWVSGEMWNHREGTCRNTPNSITNQYVWRYNSLASAIASHPVYGYAPEYYTDGGSYDQLMKTPIYINENLYYEVVRGYPRNHFIHKRDIFSLFRQRAVKKTSVGETYCSYVRNRQDNTTTIGEDGLTDGTEPIQIFNVGNVSLYKTDNVINA